MGFLNGDGMKSFIGSFWGTLLEVDGWTSSGRSGRSGRQPLENLMIENL